MKYCVLIILSLLIFSLLVDNYNCNKLPSGNIIVGYTNWGECDEKVITAVQNGVNVVIWFSINLISDAKGNPLIDDSKINSQCIAEVALALKMQNLPTTHLISIGGWNAPHIDTKFSAKQWWSLLESWNKNVIAKPMLGFHGFDGLDIDLEGNDDLSSEFNTFTIQQMDLVGNLCQLAKKGNWVVSIAPPQSYLDIGTDEFSLSVTHRPAWKTDFPYEGKNTYAYILSKFKYTTIEESDTNNTNSITRELIHTFDIVSIQLYEGWSRANYELNDLKVPLKDFMYKLIKTMNDGWNVNLPYTNSVIILITNII